ncbi:hypothetical protein LCGC14_1163710 [marine sediment metagenome]|uniref:Uncharacterized protein n=2 Tax=root TaxID=1 RepID=A0A831QSY1_9FLAO|nr:hypothetical protein [Pricia sp.]HEA22508.1 hypothetical protein [Pricia antarctica]
MQALRLLLLFVFMATNVHSFAATDTVSETQSKTYRQLDSDSYEDCNPLLYIVQSKTETSPQIDTRLKPKTFSLRYYGSAISNRKQLGVNLQYLKYRYSIDLKLASHSISYPFHSFP